MVWLRFPDHMERRSSPQLYLLHARQMQKEMSQLHTHKTYILCKNPLTLFFCVAVGADKQCELTCRPAGYRFYVRQAERVRDGTPCFNVSSNDVCVEGQCLVSGFTVNASPCTCVRFLLQVSEPKFLSYSWG